MREIGFKRRKLKRCFPHVSFIRRGILYFMNGSLIHYLSWLLNFDWTKFDDWSQEYVFWECVSKKKKKIGTKLCEQQFGRKLLVCKITSYRCIREAEQRAGRWFFIVLADRKGRGGARLPGRKGEQIPQVVDFTGLKINPHNYPIPFFSAGPPLVSAFYTVACTPLVPSAAYLREEGAGQDEWRGLGCSAIKIFIRWQPWSSFTILALLEAFHGRLT